jgi:hypothetical protein
MAELASTNFSTEDIFSSLVQNAFDFFAKAITEVETYPKYAVIDFYTCIELVLKARLMHEHWTLILTKMDEIKANEFIDGDFHSVSLRLIAARLKNIVNSPLSKDEEDCFDEIRKHRNKLVHFFHPDYKDKTSETIQNITAELLRGWYYLEQLLTKKWNKEFERFGSEIHQISSKMHSLRGFLKAKYDVLQPDITLQIAKGEIFYDCKSCGYLSANETYWTDGSIIIKCLICMFSEGAVRISCPTCAFSVLIVEGEGQCGSCKESFNLEKLISIYAPEPYDKDSLSDPTNLVYCPTCEAEAAVSLDDEREIWDCLLCGERHKGFDNCRWCGTLIAGEVEADTYVYGCIVCGGRMQHGD